MKLKVIYIIFVLITIFILIFINKKSDISQQAYEEKILQVSAEQQGLMPASSRPSLSSQGKPRITIIKKSKSGEANISSESKQINTSIRPKKTLPSADLSAVSSTKNAQGAVVEAPVAGVTKISKRPPPEETSELNEQGIVIY